ncbi:RNA-binding protein YlmH, contains S4-like domain [Alteribacillus persepolensis]|uniref:RNA-binding protein YlmH, contains S4-like domain n=1 Tax=Alteribacillus persepolensis TaxID=568899 RepID=A0A1G7YH54_9BACI|nr:RNA-binding protein [Alteribacillus persepolensis]SDG95636.1 RNA-binding protein YlmH, contains S4-like domain [Alteribacillus persepolensis]
MSILVHFRKDEHAFVEQVLEWKEMVETRYERKLTDFLDPREQDILTSVIGKDDVVHVQFAGGQGGCERKRALLYPFYEQPALADFELALFEVSYPKKFVTIGHRDVLGSLMGLGLKRSKFGDIVEGDGLFQFVAAEDIRLFIEMNLSKIGSASVSVQPAPIEKMLFIDDNYEEIESTVSSFRLDVLIADMYRLSRSKVIPFIEKGRVKVNWKTIDQASFPLEPGDYVSVRGMGRRKFLHAGHKTKKGRYKIRYGKKQDP